MTAQILDKTTWKLTTYLDGEIETFMPGTVEVTLSFDGGRASGRSGCNTYMGPVTLSDTGITFGQIAGTRMMCSPAQMAVEMAYLKLLGQISTWRRDGDTLNLGDDIGDVLASFALAS